VVLLREQHTRYRQTFHLLQTARSLLKALLAVRAGKRVAGNAAYLNDTQTESRSKCSVSSQRDWLDPAHQTAAFRWALLQHCAVFPRHLMPTSGQTSGDPDCWSSTRIDHSFCICHRHRASRLALEAATTLAEAGGGRDLQFEGPAWNSSTVDLIRLAKAHGYLVLVQNFFAHVDGLRQKVRDAPT